MMPLRNRKLTVILGALTALVIAFSQFFHFQGADLTKKEVKTEKQEKKPSSEQDAYISLPSGSLLSPVHFEFNTKAILLFEILFDDPEQKSFPAKVPVSLGKYFHTLFHIIISPNAP